MKRLFLSFVFMATAMIGFAQVPGMNGSFRGRFDLSKYEIVDSLPLERIMIHFNKEIDNEDFVDLGEGDYLAPLPHKDKMVVRYNADRTKAIVVYNSYAFGHHFEFDVRDNERRTILYYEDKHIYCGYIYDKEFSVCKYFESRKEFKRFSKEGFFKPGFIRHNGRQGN